MSRACESQVWLDRGWGRGPRGHRSGKKRKKKKGGEQGLSPPPKVVWGPH